LAAEVAYEQGLTTARVSDETIRNTLARMGVRWRRAKEWITSPDLEVLPARPARSRLVCRGPWGVLSLGVDAPDALGVHEAAFLAARV